MLLDQTWFKVLTYIVAILWFLKILLWDLKSDYNKWKLKVAVHHIREAVVRVIYLLPCFSILFIIRFQPYHSNTTLWYILSRSTITFLLIFSVWWELFDGFYNKMRGFKWRFNGTIDADDSKLDQFLYKIGDTWEGILKIGLILISLIAYILI